MMFDKISEILDAPTDNMCELLDVADGDKRTFLRGAKLSGVDIRNQDLRDWNFTGADFGGVIANDRTFVSDEFQDTLVTEATNTLLSSIIETYPAALVTSYNDVLDFAKLQDRLDMRTYTSGVTIEIMKIFSRNAPSIKEFREVLAIQPISMDSTHGVDEVHMFELDIHNEMSDAKPIVCYEDNPYEYYSSATYHNSGQFGYSLRIDKVDKLIQFGQAIIVVYPCLPIVAFRFVVGFSIGHSSVHISLNPDEVVEVKPKVLLKKLPKLMRQKDLNVLADQLYS